MDRLPEYQHAFPESQIVTYTGEGFPDFKQQIIYACAKDGQPITHNRHRIELNAEWEVPLHLPINVLTQLFTLSGDEIDAQGATCEAYIQEHFTAATELLPALQAALSSGALYETRPREQDLCYLSVRLQGPEKRKITIIAFGSLHTLKDIAQAFAWLCCALRPPPSREINLSIFNFNLSSRGNQSCVNLVIDLNLSWKNASGIESSWHKLFSNIIIVLNSPTTDRSQLRISGSSVPKGLEIPFDSMILFAGINFSFEYDRGIVLKGFRTMLVACAKWLGASGIAIQWQYLRWEVEEIDPLDYVWDSQYHIWDVGEEPAPLLETVNQARTFIS